MASGKYLPVKGWYEMSTAATTPQDSPLGPQLGNQFKLTRRTED
jgi:hypothetical protein